MIQRASTPVTACIIARDEADRIGPCLASVAFCDEILVLDSGSTDGTPDICRAAGARVIETDWPGWTEQKNRAARAARNDWVLSIDADEVVDGELRTSIEQLASGVLRSERAPRGYELARKVHYGGKFLRWGGFYPEWRLRLFDRRVARWVEPLHERVEVPGVVGRIDEGHLEHYSYRSLSDQLARYDRYTTVAAQQLLLDGRTSPAWAAALRPAFSFVRHYLLRLGFLDGRAGFEMAAMRAWYTYLKYAKLHEIERERAALVARIAAAQSSAPSAAPSKGRSAAPQAEHRTSASGGTRWVADCASALGLSAVESSSPELGQPVS